MTVGLAPVLQEHWCQVVILQECHHWCCKSTAIHWLILPFFSYDSPIAVLQEYCFQDVWPTFVLHACMNANIQTYKHTGRQKERHIHPSILSFLHTFVHTCMHTNIQTDMHAYLQTYIHTHRHANIHAYIHAYTHPYTRCKSCNISPKVLPCVTFTDIHDHPKAVLHKESYILTLHP